MRNREVVGYLLVKGCDDRQRWYAKYIGEVFPNYGYTNGEYMTTQPEGYVNFIQEEDCEIIGYASLSS